MINKYLLSAAATALCAAMPTMAFAQDACGMDLGSEAYFRISHQNSPTSPIHPRLEEIVASVSEATGGKLRLELFPSGQLGGPVQALEQASLGENIIFYTQTGNLATVGVPDFSVFNGPFLTASLEAAEELAASKLMNELTETLAGQSDLRVLAINWFDSPRVFLGQAGYPEPTDLAGVKLRSPEAPAYMRTFELLGALPLALPFSELYLALQQGVVQSVEGGLDGMADANLMEVATTVTKTDHFRLFYGFAMNEGLFQDLPESCQQLLLSEFQEKGSAYSLGMNDITAEREAELREAGIVFVDANQDAYREATAEFYNMFPEWSEGLYDRALAAMQE
jgi:TRAP-type C4-dicarboxylate transport system substrate-binding protein